MQKKLDQEFDVRLAKAFDKVIEISVSEALQMKEIKHRLKSEMYLFMASDKYSTISEAYSNAEGVSKHLGDFIHSNFKGKVGFMNDIRKILTKTCANLQEETGKKVSKEFMNDLIGSAINEFIK